MNRLFAVTLGLAALSLWPAPVAYSQGGGGGTRLHPRREIPGFDFRRDGVWRAKGRRVAARRAQLLASGALGALNAPLAAARGVRGVAMASSAEVVSGTITVPAVFFGYQGVQPQFMRPMTDYDTLLFGTTPPSGNPFTLRTFYSQLSNSLFTMLGQSIGWRTLDSAEVTYTGTPGPSCTDNPFGTNNCNGLFSNQAIKRLHDGMRQALARVDGTVNFAQFDNDGPDLIPNSGDDDGYVDMVLFAHPTRDGACGGAANNHIWSHRFILTTTNVSGQLIQSDYVTNDARSGGGTIRVSDYFVQSALGGASGCDTTQIMPIGTAAHEFGHGLGLPDLYDTSQNSEGIGHWGLMGTGNQSSATSPSRMEAWSLQQLGWVLVRSLTTNGMYTLGAAPLSDTTFFVNVQGDNSRSEFFLLENRQAVQADTALIRIHCAASGNPPGCGGGLLVWHIDNLKVATSGNAINSGFPHGVALTQADGLNELQNTSPPQDRGDAGDPYPGTTGNTAFSFNSNPAALKNLDGSFVGFAVDQITQVVAGGNLSFRLRFGGVTVVRANDTAAVVRVDNVAYNVFRDLLVDGSSHTVEVADTQFSPSGRTRFTFGSWSDGGARVHSITGNFAGDTVTATLARAHMVNVDAAPASGGTVTTNPSGVSGTLVAHGSPVDVTAVDTSASLLWDGWIGDTTASAMTITLPMTRPYAVTARFSPPLALVSAGARPNGMMGTTYSDTLRATGGTGSYTWQNLDPLPAGLTLNPATGVVSGRPGASGSFSYQARVTSGLQTQTQTFTFSVTVPVLVQANVVARILNPNATTLTADELSYLDIIGNSNGYFDVGDFLAWVQSTGATPAGAGRMIAHPSPSPPAPAAAVPGHTSGRP
ncbi:MAG: M6 family metalloprotease domain-containing protein [Gemmatimonadales bacterium]